MKVKKLSLLRRSRQGGSVLIFVVVITALVGISLASYLTLVKSQNMANMRSQSWNATVAAIEAGIEDALTHLNVNGTNHTLIKDGWSKSGDLYWITRSLSPDSYYFVTISNWTGPASTSPIIQSRGYVDMPVQVVSGNHILFADASPSEQRVFLARGVQAEAQLDPLFPKGLVSKGTIDLMGNNIISDSFDSSDPNYSTGGLYDPAKAKDNGDVATNSGLVDSLGVGNAQIAGKIATGPNGSVAVGPSGSVGSAAWISGGNTGIEPGWSSDDMNVNFPEVKRPWVGGAMTPAAGVVDGTAYTYVLDDGNWQMSNLTMNGIKKMIVTGDAILYVTGNILMSGNTYIEIQSGASLSLYVGGPSASIGGNGVMNKDGTALSFQYYGLPSNTSLSMVGNGEFIGTIYAPQADLTLNGGGNSVNDIMGGIISKTAILNGIFQFHYDEALEDYGPIRGYTIQGWDELTPAQVAALSYQKLLTYED